MDPVDQSTHEKSLQLELAKAKHASRQERFVDPPANQDLPAWIDDVRVQFDADPHAKVLLNTLPQLLKNIPVVAQSTDQTIKDNFFKQIVKELARIYCAQINMVELNCNLSESQKEQEIDNLLKQRNLRILETAGLLGSYKRET